MPPANANLPQSLLRRVETHVRIMANPEQFEHTTRGPQGGENLVTVRPPQSGDQQQQQQNQQNQQNQNNSNSNNNHPQPRQFSGFTRVHQNFTTSLDNQLFYDDVLAKMVPNALAGQSFTVLFCGAPASGRSQTMYTIDTRSRGGDITHGMLHHLAKDLLSRSNVRVLVSAYHVRGHKIFDSRNDKPVTIKNMHSPLGPTPETTSILLEKPEDAMIVPQDKRTHGSCFVTFEIYHQMNNNNSNNNSKNNNNNNNNNNTAAAASGGVDGSSNNSNNNTAEERRGAFSMITFVDVASFDDPLPSDVVALRGCLSRHIAGADPQFGTCRLSELLESSVCRGRSMLGVATVVGQPASLFEKTCSVLDFVSLLGQMEQVATVCQFVHPKWLPDLPTKLRELDAMHQERCRHNYERGVSEVYFALRRAFMAKLEEVEKHMAGNSDASQNLVEMRSRLKAQLEQALAQLQAAAEDEKHRIENNLNQGQKLKKDNDKMNSNAESEADLLQMKKHELTLQQSEFEQQQAEISCELAKHDQTRRRDERTNDELQRGIDGDLSLLRESKKSCLRAQDKIRFHWSEKYFEIALEKISGLRQQRMDQLNEVTGRAVIQDQSQRLERQRKTNNHNHQQPQQQQQHFSQSQQHNNNNNNHHHASTGSLQGGYSQNQNQNQFASAAVGTSSRLGSAQHNNNNNNNALQQQLQNSANKRQSGSRRERSLGSRNTDLNNNTSCHQKGQCGDAENNIQVPPPSASTGGGGGGGGGLVVGSLFTEKQPLSQAQTPDGHNVSNNNNNNSVKGSTGGSGVGISEMSPLAF